jgi:DNA polymerase-3 subunit delta'
MSIDQRMSDFDQKTAISQTASELHTIIQTNKIPNALLFTGKKGTGKRQAALEFAKACNCGVDSLKPGAVFSSVDTNNSGLTNKPCNNCLSCKKINSGMHPDIIQVSLAEKKKAISISQIREMGLLLSSKPNEAAMRMVLISDADLMNVQAQNALLKVLEEPPKNTFFILTTTLVSTLLPTIISRCRKIHFTPLSSHKIQQHIVDQYAIDPQKAYIATKTAGSDFKKALMFLDLTQENEGGDKQRNDKKQGTGWQKRRIWIIKGLIDLISAQNNEIVPKGLMLSQKLNLDPDLLLDTMTIIRTVLRDLCVYKYNPEKIVNLDFSDVFKDISQMYVYNTFLEWLKDLYETEKRLESNSSIRLTLDRFFLKLSSI